MLVAKLPVLYKHRDLRFYPSWAYTLPSWVLSIPTSLMEAGLWVAVTYYVIGYDPNITRFSRQFLLYFFLHQMFIDSRKHGCLVFVTSVTKHRAGNNTNFSLGEAILRSRSLFPESYWYWIGIAALFGYTVLFNLLFTFFLAYLNPLGKQQAVVSKEELQERDNRRKGENVVIELREYLQHSGSLNG
ncbi:ATP-BINDING CASSETTE TRANSPORTER [Salix purpurea]|uniref:ATP-BINDING CASSETTE TRANSPORTER n=1 Tax=Salix purpurea TaxID=77065 RepID=A0A9Q0ZEA6_SALPP|nr:ATP-BINDING CASSETTE TRANSPORTER [Salix purpurea]